MYQWEIDKLNFLRLKILLVEYDRFFEKFNIEKFLNRA